MTLKIFEELSRDENLNTSINRVIKEYYITMKEERLTKEKLSKFWKEPMAWH